jgi:hypothetical protein
MVDVIILLLGAAIYNIVLGFGTLGFAYGAFVSFREEDRFEGILCTIVFVVLLLTWILINYLFFRS